MKFKIIRQSTATCVVLTLAAVILSIVSYSLEGLASAVCSLLSLVLVLWSVMAWPHDRVYKITYLDQDGIEHEMKCYISIRFNSEQRQRCFNAWVPGKIMEIEEQEEVVHCPFRFRAIGHI